MENKPLNRIKVMMAERMVANKDLAKMMGKDAATVSKWVTNTSQPTLENLIEIARCLKCEINDLVRLEETIKVEVSGLEAVVTGLQQTAIRGIIDVSAWMEEEGHTELKGKTYSVPITFRLEDEVTVEEKIAIKITFKELEE